MNQDEWLAERFEENRARLRAVAYRMLGSLSEADDAVQESWLRLSRSAASDIENLGGESVAPIPPGVNLSTSSGAIVALADLETLELEVDVAEANVAKLTLRQPAEVTVEAFPEKRYRAELRQVIPTADRTKATVMAKVTILDRGPNLKPEMSAKATFLEAGRAWRAICGGCASRCSSRPDRSSRWVSASRKSFRSHSRLRQCARAAVWRDVLLAVAGPRPPHAASARPTRFDPTRLAREVPRCAPS